MASLCQLGCLTSTWDIGHGTSQHLTLFAARSSFPKMSNVGMSHVRFQTHLSNNQITHDELTKWSFCFRQFTHSFYDRPFV